MEVRKADVKLDLWLGQPGDNGTIDLDRKQEKEEGRSEEER